MTFVLHLVLYDAGACDATNDHQEDPSGSMVRVYGGIMGLRQWYS